MINLEFFQNKQRIFILFIFFSLIISILFYFVTYSFPWVGDDFYLIFLAKLFNNINNYSFFIDDGSYVAGSEYKRFVPLYGLIYQFLTPNFIIFNLIIVTLHFLNSIFFFLITLRLFKNNFISFFSSILFLIHYSITIKALTWAAFCGHIFNCFFGLISIFYFLKFLDYKKKEDVIISILFSVSGSMVMESGLVYPIINFFLIYFFKTKKKSILIISLFPIILYFFISFVFFQNSAYKFFFARTIDKISSNESIKHNQEELNSLYFYRSTYSPRNLKGYTIRIFDNFLNSLNLSSLEHTMLRNTSLKELLKKNYIIFGILFMFLFLTFLFSLFLILKKTKLKKKYVGLVVIYLLLMIIYSVFFHRKDLSIALSLFSTLILSTICYDLIKFNYSKLAMFIISAFTIPSLLFFCTKFEYIEDLGSWNKNKETYILYKSEILKDKENINFNLFERDFKYFYYYNNYNKYENYLKKYKNLSFKELRNSFEINY